MKRHGFVSNSSSSSFLGIGFRVSPVLVQEALSDGYNVEPSLLQWSEENLPEGVRMLVDPEQAPYHGAIMFVLAVGDADSVAVDMEKVDTSKIVGEMVELRDKYAPGQPIKLMTEEIQWG